MIGQYNLRPQVFSVRPTFLSHSRFPFTNILVDSLLKLHYEVKMTDGFSVWHHFKKMVWIPVPRWKVSRCLWAQCLQQILINNAAWSIVGCVGGTSWCHSESFELSVCTSCSTLKWFQIWAPIKSSIYYTNQTTHTTVLYKHFHGHLYGTFRSLQW